MSGHVRHICGWVNLTTAGTPLVLLDVLSEYPLRALAFTCQF